MYSAGKAFKTDSQIQDLIIYKQIKSMYQAISSISNCQSEHLSRKWSSEELQNLKTAVQEVNPSSNVGWKAVCLKMHELGSRRRSSDYKSKYLSYTARLQRISTSQQQNNIATDKICDSFQQGQPPQKISQCLPNVLRANVEIKLISIFKNLKTVLEKVVGRNRAFELKIKDHHLFAFIEEKGMKLPALKNIINFCNCWKLVATKRSRFAGKSQEEVKEVKKHLEGILKDFNEKLKEYSKKYHQYLRQRQNEDQSTKEKDCKEKGLTVASMYLKNVSQFPYQFKQQGSLLMEGSDREEEQQFFKPKSLYKPKTSIQMAGEQQSSFQSQKEAQMTRVKALGSNLASSATDSFFNLAPSCHFAQQNSFCLQSDKSFDLDQFLQ